MSYLKKNFAKVNNLFYPICMIKLFKKLLVVICLCSVFSGNLYAEVNPKLKALGLMATYGTVGGSLLGLASLAFGAEGRSVAKGASLGLYSGIIFGAYVVVSHQVKRNNLENPGDDYYPSTPENPYNSDSNFSYKLDYIDNKVASSGLEELSFRRSREKISSKRFFFNILKLTF